MAKKIKKDKKEVKESQSIDIVKKAIRKKYGNVLFKLGDHRDVKIETISSGSIGLDIALGRGGFARGRIYEIYGPPSSGKTTLAMSVIAEAQRRGLKCLFCDAEHSADPKLFEAMGVDIDNLDTVKAFSGDENLNALEMLIKTGEYGVAVVDSVSALIPKQEAEADVGDQFMGLLARLMSSTCRKFAPLCADTNTLFIFINQIRNKIGGWGDPQTTTGGLALDFYATGRIKVTGGEYAKSHIKDTAGEIIGHKTDFLIKKNKLAPPFRTAKIPLIYGVGYDNYWETLNLAEGLGVIDKHGAWYRYNGENVAQGEDNASLFLKDNEEVYSAIRESIIEQTGLKELYEQQAS